MGSVGVVVAFGGDAERLHRHVFVGRAHRFVGRLVGAIHGLAVGRGGDARAIRRADDVELDVDDDIEQRAALGRLAFRLFAGQDARNDDKVMPRKDRGERVINVVDPRKL